VNDSSYFASTIINQKYAHTLKDGSKETWQHIAHRVAKHPLKAVGASKELRAEIADLIDKKVFIPGGRYLYAAGRPFHQVQNCLLMRAEDSREGWADLLQKSAMALMTGAGIGVDYSDVRPEGKPIRKTGGQATGPLALMQMLNECGRGIMQGGARRSAIWAGLSWSHADVHKFITMKNWSPEVRALKEKDFNFPATMDGTNISVILDDDFFEAYSNEKHALHAHAQSVYWTTIRQMLKTGEPGFSVNVGENAGETLRNAPVSPDTYVLTKDGYVRVGDVVNEEINLWTGIRFAKAVFRLTKTMTPVVRVQMTGGREIVCDPKHEFLTNLGERVPADRLTVGQELKMSGYLPQISGEREARAYTLGYVYGDGTFHRKYPRAEVTFCTEESKTCMMACDRSLFTSINYKDSRGFCRAYTKSDDLFHRRSREVFPEDVHVRSVHFRASFLAGLFDADGNYFSTQNQVRVVSEHRSFLIGVQRLLDGLGIRSEISTAGTSTYGNSLVYMLTVVAEDVDRFASMIPTVRLKIDPCGSYRKAKIKVMSVQDAGYSDVYCCDVGVEEHSFVAEGVVISNCTEVTSADDSDICNLGSINMARITSLEQMERVVELATAFLLAGTVYSDVPYSKVDQVRTKNRRLGLGLMGIHEWLLQRGKKYGADDELEKYLKVYAKSGEFAEKYAKMWELTIPVKTRAIAPTGTIGIVAETTTGIEPLFCAAYKRRYLKGKDWHYQYVVDPIAQKLVDSGMHPDSIEDAYSIDCERRVAFQAWVQKYVDHSISSTINLPAWGTEGNCDSTVRTFGETLMKYLPQLRGITVYPDGARGGQPLNAVKYSTAAKHVGQVFTEVVDICDLTKGGSCGT
jgi:ribonucleotide reductase alpha subunit